MVYWQLSTVSGQLGPLTAEQALAPGLTDLPLLTDSRGQCRIVPVVAGQPRDILLARIEPWLKAGQPNWVILPPQQRQHRVWWEGQLGSRAELGFGRAAVTLALQQMNRLGEAGRLIAAHLPGDDETGIEAVMALEWAPATEGLVFDQNLIDGRLDGKTDVGALIDQGREFLPHPELLICPGCSGDDVERLLPFLRHLGSWADQVVRWEFAETLIGRLGVVGSLYNWAWLEAGYRLGDWQGQAVVLDMDESPLVGLSATRWHSGH